MGEKESKSSHSTLCILKKIGFLEPMISMLLCQTHRQTEIVKSPGAKGQMLQMVNVCFKNPKVFFSKCLLENSNSVEKEKPVKPDILGRQFMQLLSVFYF